MFTFTFDFTEQDYIDFCIFHRNNKGQYRYEKALRLGFTAIIPFLALLLNTLKTDYVDPIAVVITLILTLFTYMYITRKKAHDRIIAKQIRKIIQGKGKEHFFGVRTMTFDENDFLDRTEYEEIKTKYTKLTEIIEAEHGIYLYTSPITAIILPNRIFSSAEEKSRFLEFIQSKIQQTG